MIGTRPAFQRSVLCLSFTRNAPSNYEFAYAPLVRALTSSTGVLWWAHAHQARHFAQRNSKQILRIFETAQVLHLTGCVEGSSLRYGRLTRGEKSWRAELSMIPENHSVGIYRRGLRRAKTSGFVMS